MARRRWVRARDRQTRHEFDVPEGDKRLGVTLDHVKPVQYAPSFLPRLPKYHIDLAGRPATQEQSSPSGDDQATTTEE